VRIILLLPLWMSPRQPRRGSVGIA
jgi:hypothetical protein